MIEAVQVGPIAMRLASPWGGALRDWRAAYADYPTPGPADIFATARLDRAAGLRGWVRPQVAIAGDYAIPGALPLPLSQHRLAAEMAMNLQVALGWRAHILLHASAVAMGDRAVILSGESGSGKSTLAAQMGFHGWRFFGDEFSLLAADGVTITPYPRLISVKNAAIDALRADPALADARWVGELSDTPKGRIAHLVPPRDAIAQMAVPARARLILFPTYGASDPIRAVPPAECFIRLTQASTNYVALGERSFAALTQLVTAAPAFAFGFGDGTSGMATVAQLFAEHG